MLFQSLFSHAQRSPEEVAVVDDRGQYTYQQLAAAAAGLGMYLGMQTEKQAVGLLLPPSAGFAASFYGTLLSGKAAVPINYLLGDREIAHVIADSGVDTVVTIPQLAPRLAGADLKVIDITALPQTPPFAITPKFPSPGPNDTAVILYTSGTSGLPKGVMLTYNNLQSDVEACVSQGELQGKHRFLGVVPLFHSTGLLATLIAPVHLGAMVNYVARFSPVAMIQAIRQHQLSVIVAVPAMYGALLRLKDAGPDDFKHVYACISGGEPLPSTIRDAWQQRYGVPLYEGYGLTETIGPIAFNSPGHLKPGSVGRLIPGASARIVSDDGQPQGAGQEGEVWLRGPMIMKGYHNLPNETAQVLTADGHFKTGDIGRLDPDGYLYITGRKKELIISAGEKIVPREVEEVLARHPAVAEAAVVGKQDASRGEVPVAFVTLKEGQQAAPDALRAFVREQNLPNFKIPKEVFVVPELPHSPTGKVLKRVLSAQANAATDA
jgi:long-chain acyl-CoA synthetase